MSWQLEVDELGRVLALAHDEIPLDVTRIAGAVVAAEPGQPTAFTLFVHEPITVNGAGPIVAAAPSSPKLTVLAWLESLDADQLEKAALDMLGGFGGAARTGEAFIAALRQNAEQLTG